MIEHICKIYKERNENKEEQSHENKIIKEMKK